MNKIKSFFTSLSAAIRSRFEKTKKARALAAEERRPTHGRRRRRRKEFSVVGLVCFVILTLYAISLFVPMAWSFITSFKHNFDYLANGFGWPKEWYNNYKAVFKYFLVPVEDGVGTRKVGIGEMLANSLIYAIGSAVISTATSLCVAYACSKFRFRFLHVVYTAIIVAMIIPIVGSLPSELAVARALGLYDRMVGILVMKTYVVGMHFLIFFAAFKSVPDAYAEAAYIDGASNWQIFTRIMLPMVSGPIFTVILLNFIANWNDYTTPMVYMPNHPTLAFGLFYYVSGSFEAATSSVPMKLAGCMLMAVPLLVLFLVFHKKMLSNVTTGGLKG